MYRWLLMTLLLPALITACMKAERIGTDTNSPEGLVLGSLALSLPSGGTVESTGIQFVAVGDACTVWTSNDGAVWSEGNIGPSCDGVQLMSIARGGGLWVAVGFPTMGGCDTYSSPDAITWNQGTCPVGVVNPSAIAYGGGLFLAGGSAVSATQGAMFSSDGIQWTPVGLSTDYTTLTSLAFDGTGFNGTMSLSGCSYRTFFSIAPKTWEVFVQVATNSYARFSAGPAATSTLILPTPGAASYAIPVGAYSHATNTAAPLATFGSSQPTVAMAYGSGTYVAVGANCQGLHYSEGDPAWTDVTPIPAGACTSEDIVEWSSLAHNTRTGVFVAAGYNQNGFTQLTRSGDRGATWSPRWSSSSTTRVHAIAAAD